VSGIGEPGSGESKLYEVLTELAELVDLSLAAIRSADLDVLCDASELLLKTNVRFADRYRTFLAKRTCASSTTPGLGHDGRPLAALKPGMERSTW
jgi:hypothetical protein